MVGSDFQHWWKTPFYTSKLTNKVYYTHPSIPAFQTKCGLLHKIIYTSQKQTRQPPMPCPNPRPLVQSALQTESGENIVTPSACFAKEHYSFDVMPGICGRLQMFWLETLDPLMTKYCVPWVGCVCAGAFGGWVGFNHNINGFCHKIVNNKS